MKKPAIDIKAVLIGTAYLLLYLIFLQYEATHTISVFMLLFSPFMVIWMVYTVLRYGSYNGRDLGRDEFGYADKKKDELGVF